MTIYSGVYMNILFVTHYGALYGANKSLLDQCGGLIKSGINVFVVAPKGESDFVNEARKKNIKVFAEGTFSKYSIIPIYKSNLKRKLKDTIKGIFCRLETRKNAKVICRIIKENNIDIVHTNCSVILEGAIAAKKAKVPHIFHVRECLKPAYNSKYSCPGFVKRTVFNNSKKIIVISETVKNYISPMVKNKSKITVIHDMVELENRDTAFEKFDKKIFVSVGVIGEQKGFHHAIEAFSKMSEKAKEESELYIVGGYSESDLYYKKLVEMIEKYGLKEKVKFLGFRNDIGNIIANSYCGLTCSYMEGLGRTTIEYMLCGKPVIGSDSGATAEILRDGENGLMYNYSNTNELAEKMEYLINTPDAAKKLGQAGKKYAEYAFSEKNYTSSLLEVYSTLT